MNGKILKKYKNFKYHNSIKFGNISDSKKLILAASVSNIDELKRILRVKGTNPNCNDSGGNNQSPLHAAAKHARLDAVLQLLEYGANPNAIDLDGNTPLHSALTSVDRIDDMESIVLALVNHGANALIVNNLGQSPMDCAKKSFFLIEQLSDCYPEKSSMLGVMSKVLALLFRVYVEQDLSNDVVNVTERFGGLCADGESDPGHDVDGLLGNVKQLMIAKDSCD